MIKLYFKQAWQLMKQNKLYSSVYILGTGLAIAMTMALAIVYYIKLAPIYPELNRNRTLVARSIGIKKEVYSSTNGLSYQLLKDYLYPLKTPQAVTGIMTSYSSPTIELNKGGSINTSTMYVDHNFWNVFTFSFISGKPFTQVEFESAIKTAVISASLANKLFGTTQAEGERFKLDGTEYRVTGVVKNVSTATPETYAEIWIPYTVQTQNMVPESLPNGLTGGFKAYFLVNSTNDIRLLQEEVKQIFSAMNSTQNEYKVDFYGQPELYWKNNFRQYANKEIDWLEVFNTLGLLLITFMVVPAVNLAGLISSRMEKRIAEFGIRRTFGATKGWLVKQLLTENFLLTCIGGVVGLLFSYLCILFLRNWISYITMNKWMTPPADAPDTVLRFEMLFNPTVFFITLLCCFILNFISAIIPISNIVRKNIVRSLNHSK